MKLASLNKGRDGALVVVSTDLGRMVRVEGIPTLQAALDDWENAEPKLKAAYDGLMSGNAPEAEVLLPHELASPLPRAYQFADGSAYVTHVELVRKARGADMPESFWSDPLMYQGMSDGFLAPTEDIVAGSEDWGIDFEAEVAVITGDVPMGVSVAEAAKYIRLILLVNDVSLRNLIPSELAKGFGFFQSKPASSFSPVAVTPEELGDKWKDGRVHLPLVSTLNGVEIGRPNAGVDMAFNFPQLIAHAAKSRKLGAGTIIGSGTVSNTGSLEGSSCLAEVRALEMIKDGKPSTPFMKFGDVIKIEMRDDQGRSIFGTIEQTVVPLAKGMP